MRRYLLCILLMQVFVTSEAQHSAWGLYPNIPNDSLFYLINKETTDTVKVRLLNYVAGNYFQQQKDDSALMHAQKALDLSLKHHYLIGEFESRKWWPIILRERGDYPNALKIALLNLQIAEQIKDVPVLLIGIQGVARTYDEMKDFTNALKYGRRSKTIVNSGFFKNEKELKQNKLFYYLVMIGASFQNLKQYDSALSYIKEAYNIALELKEGQSLALTSANLGAIYFELDKYDSARYCYKKTLQYVDKLHGRYDLAGEAQISLAKISFNQGKLDSALYYSRLSLQTYRYAKYPAGEFQAASFLNTLYAKENRTDSAYKYLALKYSLKDSLYNLEKTKQIEETKYSDALKRQQQEQEQKEAQQHYQAQLKIYFLIFGLGVLLLVAFFLFRSNRQNQKTNTLLHQKNAEVENQRGKAEQALQDLKATQAQLIHSEKMASLGELTAGIAHEIQNPLNFVNNFSETNMELIDEAQEELKAGNQSEIQTLLVDIKENEQKINRHGKRADGIVKSMLEHSSVSSGTKVPSDLNKLTDEYLRLAYHGVRAKDKTFNATIHTHFDESIDQINIIPQEISRVLLNLFNNAFYAIKEKQKQAAAEYVPIMTVKTKKLKETIEILIADNGTGIPQKEIDKIFQPFFTTKPTGEATGLGLSLSYDIVKAHNGEIKVESKEGEGSAFKVLLPL